MLNHNESTKQKLSTPPPNNNNDNKKKTKPYYDKLFLIILITLNIFIYIIYTYETLYKSLIPTHPYTFITLLLTYHIIFILLIISFWKTVSLLPGTIPPYWGFYIGDDDNKRKRYCLICNCFKPERTHHCSVCNICILNMDHHCPWVNNCIGFYNRKYFIQLLGYTLIYAIYISLSLIYFVYDVIINIIDMQWDYNDIIHGCLVTALFGFSVAFVVIIGKFFKFHIELVITNSTTIESLDKEHKKENQMYDIGVYENWIQVFGENKLLWFLPFEDESGKPCGEGLSWKKKDDVIKEEFKNKFNFNNPSSETDHPTDDREHTSRKKIELTNIIHNNITNYTSN